MKNNTYYQNSQFSHKLIEIININGDKILRSDGDFPQQFFSNKKNLQKSSYNSKTIIPQPSKYLGLMSKLDESITESRKTQKMIIEKQQKCEFSASFQQKTSIRSACLAEINKILASIVIPECFQRNCLNNIVLKKICQQRLYETQDEISSLEFFSHKNSEKIQQIPEFQTKENSNEKTESFLLTKMKKIKQKSGFDMMRFIEDLYELALKNKKENMKISPFRKQNFKEKLLGFESVSLSIEEDLSWKNLSTNQIFYKENLCENVKPNYLAFQAIDTAYEMLLGVYLCTKQQKKPDFH